MRAHEGVSNSSCAITSAVVRPHIKTIKTRLSASFSVISSSYSCVCVCVCVCARARVRVRAFVCERESARVGERASEQRDCVDVHTRTDGKARHAGIESSFRGRGELERVQECSLRAFEGSRE